MNQIFQNSLFGSMGWILGDTNPLQNAIKQELSNQFVSTVAKDLGVPITMNSQSHLSGSMFGFLNNKTGEFTRLGGFNF